MIQGEGRRVRTREDRSARAGAVGRGRRRKGTVPGEGAESKPGLRCNEFPLYFYGGERAEASSAVYGRGAVKCLYLCHGRKAAVKKSKSKKQLWYVSFDKIGLLNHLGTQRGNLGCPSYKIRLCTV
jgi:hypothetical protein